MNRVAVAVPGRTAGPLVALWRFSRPHTVIGTTVSIVCLYLIAVDTLPGLSLGGGLWDLLWTLVAGLAVNVYIVGVNQLEDVEIDRVNKPFLPLAAGDMTHEQARTIVAACAGLAVVLAVTQGLEETVAVLVGIVSAPRTRRRRCASSASPCSPRCRSPACARSWSTSASTRTSRSRSGTRSRSRQPVWALTLVVIPFSFAIAILKDVPDAEGDRRFRIMTFTVRRGGRAVMHAGIAALVLGYLGMAILGPVFIDTAPPVVLAGGQLAALALLLVWARGVDPADQAGFTRFYMRVWKLFFLEYVLVALACLAG